MKKILALLLVLVLALSAGCSAPQEGGAEKETEAAKTEAKKIGYVINNLNDTFQTFIFEAAKAKAESLGYEIDIQDSQEDVIRQQDQVKALIEKKVDALVVVPVDTSAMAPITKAANEAGIPLVYVNRNPFGEGELPKNVFYVGSQEIIGGRLQAEELVKVMGEEGKVCILMGILSNEGAVKRTEGNKEVLSNYAGIEVLAEETGNWQTDQGMSLTENWLTAYGEDLKAILANNDDMALGAIQAAKAAGREDLIIIGLDATPAALEAVEAGTMAATVLQDAKGQGEGAVMAADKAVKGESQDAVTWIDFVLVNKDNVGQYKK